MQKKKQKKIRKKNPIEALKEGLANMTEAQKKVADHIIRNHFDVSFATIDQVAAAAETSTTTIMRLMSAIGYSGYSEFQKALQAFLREQVHPRMRLEANIRSLDQEDLWNECFQKELDNISATIEDNAAEDLDAVVTRIASARRVYVASARGGAMVAQFLHLFLARIFGNSVLIQTDSIAEWSALVPDADARDVAVIFSYPRYSRTIRHFARAMRKQDAFVVGVTNSYSAPLAQHAHILLPCSCASSGFHNSPVAAMALVDCIISVASIRYSSRVKPRLEMSAALLDEVGYYDTV